MVVFTVVNMNYVQLGLAWGRRLREASGAEPVFICSESSVAEVLTGQGFSCRITAPERPLSGSAKTEFPRSTFASDEAAYTVSMKMTAALDYLQRGQSVLFSDVDAIWFRDMIPDLLALDVDLAFQPGSFPAEAKSAWGFTVCNGFLYLRPTEAVLGLVRAAIREFDGSDQRTFNNILLRDFDIVWERRPEAWEHCRIEGGWTEPVMGRSRRTGMRLAALPHALYQRHGTYPGCWRHSVICHPNSPKDADRKFAILRDLGIDI